MIFLANENFPLASIFLLRNAGYHVHSIKETTRGISDITVLALAEQMNAVILTFDKDYGEIIFRNEMTQPPAVVFFRHKGYDAAFAGNTLLHLIENEGVIIEGFFTVIEQENIRQRKL